MAITTKAETITPAKALKYLEGNKNNRRVRPMQVARVARIIKEDKWKTTHQGIAFNCDGSLLDGQHRLLGIVEANKSVKVLVTRGLPRETVFGIDQGTGRDLSDVAQTMGVKVTPQMASCARMMLLGTECRTKLATLVYSESLMGFINEHWDALVFASVKDSVGPGKNAAFRAVIARAYYTANRKRLEEFAEVCKTGIMQSEKDQAAIKIRDFYLRNSNRLGGWIPRNDFYRRAEYALSEFLKGKPLGTLGYGLRRAESELFPIPGEVEQLETLKD